MLQVAARRWRCRVRVENKVGLIGFAVEYRWELTQQSDAAIDYDLGQCMTHTKEGFRGVIIGWDCECRQSEEWCNANEVDSLTHGRSQPFYHVLVDRRDHPTLSKAYVAQEHVMPAAVQKVEHEYFNEDAFVGVDERRGVWKPSRLLREQYPLGVEGCWLVDQFLVDRSEEPKDFDA